MVTESCIYLLISYEDSLLIFMYFIVHLGAATRSWMDYSEPDYELARVELPYLR